MNGADGPGSSDRVRIGDAEREQFSAILGEHYAQGRLTLDELRRRIDMVLAAEYADQAAAALAELPALPGPVTAIAARDRTARDGSRQRGLLSRRGHAESAQPASDWKQTTERFRDPSSGVIMRVWLDADGARHYVPD